MKKNKSGLYCCTAGKNNDTCVDVVVGMQASDLLEICDSGGFFRYTQGVCTWFAK